MPKIETVRLILREYEPEDWSQIHEYCQDPDVTKYMIWGPNTEEQTQEFINRTIEERSHHPRTAYEFAVVLKETGRVVGGIGIRTVSERRKEANFGYCYHPQMWGKGIGTEAAQAILKFGFEELGLHRIFATCDAENIGSAAIMRKNGMKQEGHFRQDELIKGRWRDTLIHAMLEDEWEQIKDQVRVLVTAG